jgi:uncharacterized membrane protein
LHPKLVHLPIALAVLMPFIAGGISAAMRREWLPQRAWLLVVVMQAILPLSGLAAANTGESDAERVEEVAPREAIAEHEQAANWFIGATSGVLALAIAALVTTAPGMRRAFVVATLVGTVFVMFIGQRVGELGGELVYKHNAARAYISAPKSPTKSP